MKRYAKLLCASLLTLLLAILSVMPAFAEFTAEEEESIRTYIESVLTEMPTYDDATLEQAITAYDSYGMPGISEGFKEWQNVGKDTGEFVSLESFSMTEQEDGGTVIAANAVYTNKTVACSFTIGSDGYVSAVSFSNPGESTDASGFGAKMKEASVNLIVGMGTVFAVLIFLCWVISLFKYVGRLDAMLHRKKAKETAAEIREKAAEVKETAEVIPLDNNELQAVIAAAIAAYEADTGCGIEKQPALENGISIKTYRRN